MKKLFDNYYKESFSQSKSQSLSLKSFELTARKYKWNYQRFFSKIPKDANILDLGSGLGQFLFYLKNEHFQNLSGIDISKSQVALALEMQPQIDIRHVEDPVTFLLERQEQYDVITMNDVLEHIELEQTIPLLNTLHHSLKLNGIILIKTINGAYPLGSSLRYIDFTHTTAFHEKSLIQLLRHTGFSEIHCYQEEIGIYNPLFALKKSIVVIVRLLLKILIYFSESDWPKIISPNLIVTGKK